MHDEDIVRRLAFIRYMYKLGVEQSKRLSLSGNFGIMDSIMIMKRYSLSQSDEPDKARP